MYIILKLIIYGIGWYPPPRDGDNLEDDMYGGVVA